MSHFYGTLAGNRGQASRCATKASGITTVAASWTGAVEVSLHYDEESGENRYFVQLIPWHGVGRREILAQGKLEAARVTS